MYLVISSSTSVGSRSRRLADRIVEAMQASQSPVQLLDLAACRLPHEDIDSPQVRAVNDQIAAAAGIAWVLPIYHGDVGISARNLLQLTHRRWARKVVGIACVTGTPRTAGAAVQFAANLVVENRVFLVPDFVFAASDQLSGSQTEPTLAGSIDKMTEVLTRMTTALSRA